MAIFAALPAMVSAQARQGSGAGRPEMTVEQSYLQESIIPMIIREQSRSESRDIKLLALENIGNAIDKGNKSEEIHSSLEFLSLEGIVNPIRQSGRVANDFPDVRIRAAFYLGQLGSPEARRTLLRMLSAENEPMILAEVMKSLGRMGKDESSETINAIARTVDRFTSRNPDNLLALAAIEAIERINGANGRERNEAAIRTFTRISEGPYMRSVQDRARRVIADMRRVN